MLWAVVGIHQRCVEVHNQCQCKWAKQQKDRNDLKDIKFSSLTEGTWLKLVSVSLCVSIYQTCKQCK